MRRRSLRLRIALAVGIVATAMLAVIGFVLVSVVDGRMHASVRAEALRAVERAEIGVLSGATEQAVTLAEPGDPAIQLFAQPVSPDAPPGGAVGILGGEPPPAVATGETVVERRQVGDASLYVAATSIEGRGGPVTVAASVSLNQTESTIATLRTAAWITVPLVGLALGVLAFFLVDRSLRPVYRMQAEADLISHGTLHRRITPTDASPELADLARTMNEMLDRLEQAADGQRRFASDASHELRSPLTTLRATIELGERRPEAVEETTSRALCEIDRLDRLVADLLTLSRLEEVVPAFTDVDLDDLVRSYATAPAANPAVQVDTTRVAHARISGDPAALAGLIRNLLDNATRHARSRVIATLEPKDRSVHLTIEDDGPGIPVAERRKVFDRFTRLDESRERHRGGSGLGLAITAAAVRAHHGTVAVDESPSLGGARFTVGLPVSPVQLVSKGTYKQS